MSERVSPLAGKPAPRSLLVNIPRLVTAYFALTPNPEITSQRVRVRYIRAPGVGVRRRVQ